MIDVVFIIFDDFVDIAVDIDVLSSKKLVISKI